MVTADAARPAGNAGDPREVAVPAATVVLLRDGRHEVETLMLRRDAGLEFGGGAWVFPGGRVDPGDYAPGVDPATADADEVLGAARAAAVRETAEEAGLVVEADALVWFAHWTPNMRVARRYATWFFATRAPEGDVVIDDGEIRAHEWVAPGELLERHRGGDVSLMVPTWATLAELRDAASVDELLAQLGAQPPVVYGSKVVPDRDGVAVALWSGDAGYEVGDPDVPGARHRLTMRDGAWEVERT